MLHTAAVCVRCAGHFDRADGQSVPPAGRVPQRFAAHSRDIARSRSWLAMCLGVYLPRATRRPWSVTLGKSSDEAEAPTDFQCSRSETRAPVVASRRERGRTVGRLGPAHRSIAAREHGRARHRDPVRSADAGARGEAAEGEGGPAPSITAAQTQARDQGRPRPLAARALSALSPSKSTGCARMREALTPGLAEVNRSEPWGQVRSRADGLAWWAAVCSHTCVSMRSEPWAR